MNFRTLFLLVFIALTLSMHGQTSNYVTVEGQQFRLNGNPFYPVAVNYLVTITKNHTNNTYYLSPNGNHSDEWGWPNTGGNGRFIYSTTDDIGISHQKLLNDMSNMNRRGFNTLRVIGFAVKFENGSIKYPNDCSETVYFEKIEEMLAILQNNNLKAILLINAPMDDESYDMVYCKFLERLASRFKNKTSLMGYDFLNEPTTSDGGNAKYILSSRISSWHYAIKKGSSHHLTTIGYSWDLTAAIDWDPSAHPVDFASFHIYAWSKDLEYSKNKLAAELYWYGKTTNKAWIIGETGYAGTNLSNVNDSRVGSESMQKSFADFTLQRALDCNCSGYTWWQNQEIHWQSAWEDYLGLITYFNKNQTNNGEKEKLAIQSFQNFNPNNKNLGQCVKPDFYYNMNGYTLRRHTGRVVNTEGDPIENAIIKDGGAFTFSDKNGNFTLYKKSYDWFTDEWEYANKNDFIVGAQGYQIKEMNEKSIDVGTITLYSSSYINGWIKKWSNNSNNNIAGWGIGSNDKFYSGDFDGDGIDELLCVNQNSGGWITLLDYYNETWHWKWSTYGSTTAGTYLYNFRNNLISGDFDGDGKDELFGVSSYGMRMFEFNNNNFVQEWYKGTSHSLWPYINNLTVGDFDGNGKDDILGVSSWITTFYYSNGDWHWWRSDNGSSSMQPYKNNLIAGDFDGDNKDEILGISSWITIFKYNGNSFFNWLSSDEGNSSMQTYKNNLIVGNFDSDPADEILGIYTWATKFDFHNNKWNWSWSTQNSAILGDWPVNRNNTCLFTKAETDEPEYLMVMSTNSSSDFCKMFLKNPLDEANTINTFTLPFTVNGSNINESNDWDVQGCDGADVAYKFYLPSSSKIKATLCHSLTNYDTKLEIFNEDGTRANYYNDDYSCSYNNLYSTINNIQLSQGYYYAVVDGYCGRTGNFELSISLDNTKSATVKSSENTTVLSDTDDLGKYDKENINNSNSILDNIQVYPNPTQDILNIILPNEINCKIDIIDVRGKTVHSLQNKEGVTSINCSGINTGVYLLRISSEKEIYQQKIVIQ